MRALPELMKNEESSLNEELPADSASEPTPATSPVSLSEGPTKKLSHLKHTSKPVPDMLSPNVISENL